MQSKQLTAEDVDEEESREVVGRLLMLLRPILMSTAVLKEHFGDKEFSKTSFEEIVEIAKLLNHIVFHIKQVSKVIPRDFSKETLSVIQEMDKFFESQINRVVH